MDVGLRAGLRDNRPNLPAGLMDLAPAICPALRLVLLYDGHWATGRQLLDGLFDGLFDGEMRRPVWIRISNVSAYGMM